MNSLLAHQVDVEQAVAEHAAMMASTCALSPGTARGYSHQRRGSLGKDEAAAQPPGDGAPVAQLVVGAFRCVPPACMARSTAQPSARADPQGPCSSAYCPDLAP